jgi:class 3 adenylate cyclase
MARSEHVAILFADIAGSTKLFDVRGDIVARGLVAHALTLLGEVAAEHSGRVIKTIGDEVMCAFKDAASAFAAAVSMQRRIDSDETSSREGVAVRIGFHSGTALLEGDDVFGQAVNVAARVASLAKREQILATAETLTDARPGQVAARSLGAVYVSGKIEPIDVVEISWREPGDVTTLHPPVAIPVQKGIVVTLKLRHLGRTFRLDAHSRPLTLGRDRRSGLVIDAEWVSRDHAVIECQWGHFLVRDHSTNGTWVCVGQEPQIRLHRTHHPLRKSGAISLGQPIAPQSIVRIDYEQTGTEDHSGSP